MPRVRLGVVLLVPPPVAAEVDGLRRALGDQRLDKIAPHVTLVPPVNVRDDRLVDAVDVLRGAAAAHPPLTLRLGPVATFLPASPTLYLAVDDERGGDDDRGRDDRDRDDRDRGDDGGDGDGDGGRDHRDRDGDDRGREGGAIVALRRAVFVAPLHRKVDFPFVPHVTLADEAPPARLHAALDALADYRADVVIDRVHLMQEQPDRTWRPIADAPLGQSAVVRNRGAVGHELALTITAGGDPETRAFESREWPIVDDAPWVEDPFVITARRDGAVVGVARGWTAGGVGYLGGLIVGAAHRGEGIGGHLLAAFTSLSAQRGCPRLALRTFTGSPAHGFYRDRGWVDEAHFQPWVFGRDFVQLRRDLAD